jgi:hypothetical protein
LKVTVPLYPDFAKNMSRKIAGFLVVSLLVAGSAAAQEAGARAPTAPAPGAPGKVATAVRVENGAINLDGGLNDAVWAQAVPITDFMQKEPNVGAAPTNRMEVRFVYDDNALYVGAKMYSSDPAGIQAPLGPRDGVQAEAEHISLSFDTFLDRRTAYTFGVTASGVRLDRYHSRDDEGGDNGFNPVWEAATRIDEDGWTAELWIPFTQLRFADQPLQIWGLNVRRFIPTLEEEVYWVMVPRTEQGWASRFGDLHGIEGVRPSRRVELMPFVVASTTMNANRDLDNPFDDGRNLIGRAGLDLKMGVGPNMTLDATFNPDFGQVEADPAEVNLSAFASRFPERRPFFTEGSDLLNLRHPNVFYSRRIGSAPAGRASGDYVDRPETSSILGAAKLTGRLPSGRSIGVLAAVTAEEHAEVYNIETDEFSKVRVGAYAGYGLVRVQQDYGQGSNASVLVGALRRDVGEGDALSPLLVRTALVVGTDGLMRIRNGEYEWAYALVGSFVEGDNDAMTAIQRSSSHYMQRPDKTYGLIDPTRESLSGASLTTSFNRVAGEHWLFGASTKIDTPTFETNDIAQLNGADGIQPNVNLTYRETRPGSVFRQYSIRLNQGNEWNFGLERQAGSVGSTVNVTWLNFWTTSIGVTRDFRTRNAGLTRGGPLMGGPSGWRANVNLGNRATAQNRVSGGISVSRNELDGKSISGNVSFSFRPGPRWQLSIRPSYNKTTDAQQYISTLSGGRQETFGSRYIFAYIDRNTLSSEVRMSLTVKPDLTFDLYAEPFAASGRYYDYGELLEPGSLDRLQYGLEGTGTTRVVEADGDQVITAGGAPFTLRNRDFNVRSFNSNAVLRWEWRPGSTMYLVWQQSRDYDATLSTPVGIGDVFRSVNAPGSNILLFKTSWWLPVE